MIYHLFRRNRQLMAQSVKKDTLKLLLLRGGITDIDQFDTTTSKTNTLSVREDIANRDIRGK